MLGEKQCSKITVSVDYFTCIISNGLLVALVCSFYLTFILDVESTEGLNEGLWDKILRLAAFRELRGERRRLLGVQVLENLPLSGFGLNKNLLPLACF